MKQTSGAEREPPVGSREKLVVKWLTVTVAAVTLVLSGSYIFQLAVAGRIMTEFGYHYLLLGLFLPLAFLRMRAKRGLRGIIPWYDIVFATATFASCLYLFFKSMTILQAGWAAKAPLDGLIPGFIVWVLSVEACRRAGGMVMALIAGILSFYPLIAPYLPGLLVGPPITLPRLISYHAFSNESIQGVPMQAFGRIIVGYLILASALLATGGGQFFLNFAMGLLGHVRGGAAKVAVIASATFGMMSGSAVVNVITIGPVTIPAMKKTGYPAYYAGAVEACTSTADVLTPPVMGATAFIMADFLGVPYAAVCLAATIPSVLYYTALFVQADLYAVKSGLHGLRRSELPSLPQNLKEGWFFLFAIALLVFFLFFMRAETVAPFYATAALFLASLIRKATRPTLRTMIEFFEKTGSTLTEIVAILAPIGLLLGALSVTGLAFSLATGLVTIAQGNLAVIVILGAAASYVMGMGTTITACYVFLAMVLAPAMTAQGVSPMGAHLFLLYTAMLSAITPPVALATYTAAAIAESDFMKTGWQACRLGMVLFFLPILFVVSPESILQGAPADAIQPVLSALVGIVLASAGMEGYLWRPGVLPWGVRVPLFVAGILLFIPGLVTDCLGLGIASASLIGLWALKRRRRSVASRRGTT